MRLEVLSQNDYYFLYEHKTEVFGYDEIRETQQLTPPFADYPTMLIKLFNQVISDPEHIKCQLQLYKDNTGDLYFNQILDYKVLLLLQCRLEQGSEDKVQRLIKFRHKQS